MAIRTLLLDCETAPNLAHVWGLWNQNVSTNQLIDSGYTLCWAAKWLGEKKVMFDSIYQSPHEDMVKGIHALVDEADAVIHYNGTKFDMPTLNKEFLLVGLTPPSPYKQIDLLRTARQQFRFPSNKLDYIAKSLGLGEKVKHVGHELWIKCMNKDPKAWQQMEKYNKQDVVLLERVYNRLLPWIKNHPNQGVYAKRDGVICTNCGSDKVQRRGIQHTTTLSYHRHQCTECGTWMRSRAADKSLSNPDLLVRA